MRVHVVNVLRPEPGMEGRTLDRFAGFARQVEERGFTVLTTPLQAFLRSGGSACCLTLRLDHRSEESSGGEG